MLGFFQKIIGSMRLLTVFTCCLVFVGATSFDAHAEIDSRLELEVERYIKGLRKSGKIRSDERTAWSVYDFKNGKKLVSINEKMPLQAASMIKPYLALAFFHKAKQGSLIYGPTSRKHMELMIQVSNNDSTNWVMRQVGGPSAVQTLLKKHYPSLCQNISIVEYIPAGGKTYRNKGSALDYSRFLYALWNGNLPNSTELKRLMALPGNDRLYTKVRNVPQGTLVYNKTGSTSMCCGDMGILYVRDKNGQRHAYTLIGIIESQRRNTSSYTSWISTRANVIRGVSNIVYADMKKRLDL